MRPTPCRIAQAACTQATLSLFQAATCLVPLTREILLSCGETNSGLSMQEAAAGQQRAICLVHLFIHGTSTVARLGMNKVKHIGLYGRHLALLGSTELRLRASALDSGSSEGKLPEGELPLRGWAGERGGWPERAASRASRPPEAGR